MYSFASFSQEILEKRLLRAAKFSLYCSVEFSSPLHTVLFNKKLLKRGNEGLQANKLANSQLADLLAH